MEEQTTPWYVAEVVRESRVSPLLAWAAAGLGAAVVVVGGILYGAGPGVVPPVDPAVTSVAEPA